MANTLKIKRGTAATIPQGQLAEPLFTTDTYDLYIGKGSGGNQRIQNYIASGTSSQFLKGDGSLDSNTYQTALTFSSPLVNTSGTVTINQSSGSVDGYLSSTDWTTFNSKEPAITAGTTLQYYRGDKTFQTLDTSVVPENGPIYFTEPRVRATVLTGLNLSGGGTIAATDSILTAFGKVQNQISALVGGATYQGTWNASTNTPTLASGTGTKGYYYVVSVAGSTNLDGITDWKIGDWAIFNGTTWDKVDNTDAVSSVNGFTGAVNLALDNISDVSAASPTNAQLLRFNGTSSLWENWTPTYISAAITSLNGLTDATQTFAVGTTGTDFNISSATGVHTFNIPSASAANRGLVTIGAQTFAGDKTFVNDLTIDAAGDGYIKLWNAYSGTPSNPGIEVKNYNGDTTFSHNSNGGGTVITGSFTIDKSDVANNLQLRLKQGSRQYWDFITGQDESLKLKPQKSTLNEFPSFIIQDKDGNDKFSLNTNTSAAIFSGTLTASNFSGSSSGTNTGDQTNISGNAATATKLETARTLTIGATGKTFDGSANVSWTLGEIGAAAALSGTSGRIAYWNSGTTIAADDSLLFSPTSTLAVNNFITAAAGGASAFNLISTINAAANNDILYGVRISPTFNNGAFTGVTQRALGVFGDVYINGTITSGAWNGSVIGSSYGGAGTVNGIMKANGSGTVSAAVAGTDYVIPSALSSYLPLTGGTLTGALSGTSATFSGIGLFGGATNVDSLLKLQITTTGAGTQAWVGINKNNAYGLIIGYSEVVGSVGSYIRNVTADPMYFVVNNTTTALTLASSGAATFSSSSGIGMTIRADWDRSATNNSQLYIQGNSNTNKQLRIGYDTTGNVGYIQALTSGTSVDNLLINPSGGNVGIGSTSPTNGLLVLNSTAANGVRLALESSGTMNGIVALGSNAISGLSTTDMALWTRGVMAFETGASGEKMRITSGGNVGIGFTSPDVALHIVKAPNTNNDAVYNLILQDPTAFSSRIGAGVSFGGYYDSTNTTFTFANIKGFKENTTSGDYAGALAFSTRTNGGNPTERMRITSGGNVGIGTSSPSYKLSIESSDGTIAYQSYTYGGSISEHTYSKVAGVFIDSYQSAGASLYTKTTDIIANADAGAESQMRFFTASSASNPTERMRITSGGKVGIGQTAPGVALSVAGQTESWQLALTNVTGTAGAVIGSPSADVLAFGNWAGTERMRITSGGNVGIGTTSPGYLLHVLGVSTSYLGYFGFSQTASASNGLILLQSGRIPQSGGDTSGESGVVFNHSGGTAGTNFNSNGGYIKSIRTSVFDVVGNTNTALVFATTAANTDTERMRITSGGKVGIGNTNPASYNADANNLVVGTGSANGGITITTGIYDNGSIYFAEGTSGTSAYKGYIQYQQALDDLVFGTSGIARFTISGAGFYYLTNILASSTANAANVYVSTTSGLLAYSTSSRKYKHDIRPYDRGINDLMKMNPVYYKGINDGNTQFAGLIAEEIDQLGMKEYVDYLNNEPNALRYSNMVTILVKAIQELKTELDTLKNR